MRRGLIALLLGSGLLALPLQQSVLAADAPVPANPVAMQPIFHSTIKDKIQDIFRAAAPTPASDYAGVYFASSAPSQVMSRMFAEYRNENGTHVQHICTGADDATCSPANGFTEFSVVSGIGNCAANPNASCVESFSIVDSQGKEHKATPESKFPAGASEFKGSPGNYPGGLTPWIWKIDGLTGLDTSEYFLNGSIISRDSTTMPGASGKSGGNTGGNKSTWSPKVNSFSFEITPVTRETSPLIKAPVVMEETTIDTKTTEVVLKNSLDGCVANDEGICLHRANFSAESTIRLVIHLPHNISGWLVGRLDRPAVSIKKVSDTQDAVSVEAGFLQNIVAGKYLKRSSLDPAAFNPPASCPQSQRFQALGNGIGNAVGMDSGEDCALAQYKKWSSYLGDSAFVVQQGWTLASPTVADKNPCLKQGSGLQAVVASNASAFDPGAPAFDSKAQKLTYQVAAPIYAADGKTENVGRYGVTMSADLMKCLYGVKTIPSQVNIGITGADGTNVIQSATLNSKNNWVYFAADNFRYSDLSILTVTLPKAPATKATAKPSAKPTPVKAKPSSAPSKNAKK